MNRALRKLILPPALALAGMCAITALISGCNDWERQTFQTLSASQAVVNKAQDDYEARVIPKTQASYAAITKAKAVQNAAVDAFADYERAKQAKAGSATLQAKEAATETLLQQLPALIQDVKAIYGTPTSSKGAVMFRPGPKNQTALRRDPLAALRRRAA